MFVTVIIFGVKLTAGNGIRRIICFCLGTKCGSYDCRIDEVAVRGGEV